MKPRPNKSRQVSKCEVKSTTIDRSSNQQSGMLDCLYINENCLGGLEKEAVSSNEGYPLIGLLSGDRSNSQRRNALVLGFHRLKPCWGRRLEQRVIAPHPYHWDETCQRIKNAGQSITDGPFSVDHPAITQLLDKNDARLVIQLDRILRSIQGRDYIEAGVRLDIFQRLNGLQILPLPFKILDASYATPNLIEASRAACIDLGHRMSRLKQLIFTTSETLFEAWRKNHHQRTEKDHTYFCHLLAQMLARELSFAWSDTQKKFPILDNLSFHEAPTTRMKGFTAAVNKQLANELEPFLAPIKRPRTLSNPTPFRSTHHLPPSLSSSKDSNINNTGASRSNLINGANDLEMSKSGIVNKPIPRPILPAVISSRPRTPSNNSISSGSGSPKPSSTSPLPTGTLETETSLVDTRSDNNRPLVPAPIPLKLVNDRIEEELVVKENIPASNIIYNQKESLTS